jgi:Arc/MetJ-type ribon-helix-helix transcriptional regulator
VKTVQKNISLSEELADFAKAEAEEGGYGSMSDYFADLVRQRRQQQIQADLELLHEAMDAAPGAPEPSEKILAAAKRARRQMETEDWRP